MSGAIMSKYILLPKPVKIISWCTECEKDTEQTIAFIKYEVKFHLIHYLNRCSECRKDFKATANIKYWIAQVAKGEVNDRN